MSRVAKGLELGANDYLLKPIDRNELLARVRTQVRRKRYHEKLRHNYEQSLSMALVQRLREGSMPPDDAYWWARALCSEAYLKEEAPELAEQCRVA